MSRKKELKILPLGDLHYGNPTFNENLFERWLQIAKQSKHKVILLNGDLLEFLDANRFYKPHDYIDVNQQLEYVIEALTPYKKHIICNLTGNHGQRTMKQYDLNTDRLIGDALGVETTTSLHYDLCCKKGKNPSYIRVFMQHTAPTSTDELLAMRRYINKMEKIEADLFLAGHNHRVLFAPRIYRGIDYTPIRKYYCFTGSFLDYKGSYADGKFDFQIPGFPVLSVDSKKNIQCKIYWADNYGE